MSVVVGIKQNGKVYLGCDCQVSCGDIKRYTQSVNNFKIWKVKGVQNCFMGSVGAVRDACALRVVDNLVDELAALKGEIDFEYVVTTLVPTILSVLKEFKYVGLDESGVFQKMDSAFLFAYQDKLFEIYHDGSVFEIEDFTAIGSGLSDAIGSLNTSANKKNITERITDAVAAASNHDLYVSGPVIIVDTASQKFKIVS